MTRKPTQESIRKKIFRQYGLVLRPDKYDQYMRVVEVFTEEEVLLTLKNRREVAGRLEEAGFYIPIYKRLAVPTAPNPEVA